MQPPSTLAQILGLSPGTGETSASAGGFQTLVTRLADRPMIAGWMDGAVSNGTWRIEDFAAFAAMLDHARKHGLQVLLSLDTAGVRVDESSLGIAGFKRALDAVCAFVREGGEGVTIIPGPVGCFGAGYELALCLGPVLMAAEARAAVAGPRAIAAAVGLERFDARDASQVLATMGGLGRAARGQASAILESEAEAARRQIIGWIGGDRLGLARRVSPWQATGSYKLLGRFDVAHMDNILYARLELGGRPVELLGVVPGTELTAERARRLADLIRPESPVDLVIVADAEQSLDPAEEEGGVALAYACLAHKLVACKLAGRIVISLIEKGGSGAALMALGMTASRVVMARDALYHSVAPRVAAALLGDAAGQAVATGGALHDLGVVDVCLEGRATCNAGWCAGAESEFRFPPDRWMDAYRSRAVLLAAS